MTHAVAKFFAAFFIAITMMAGLAPAAGAQSDLLFGQNHYYSVVFRGNGEAVVYAKMIIPNPGDTPLADLSFQVPGAIPTEMAIYQMTVSSPCMRYAPMAPGLSSAPCMEYGAPSYDNSAYYYGNDQAHYTKVDFTNSGNLYKFTLPNPVEANQTTAVVVAYAARGYVKNSFGLFKFNFETLKVPSRISSLQVAVDVDSDLILKGKKAVINYTVPASATATGLGLASGKADVASPEFNRTVSSIGSYGALVKTAKNLSPNESFTVKGEYSASWWRLNLFGIVMTVLIIAAIIVGIYFLSRFLKRKHKKTEAASAPKAAWAGSDWINITNAWVSIASAAAMAIGAWFFPIVMRAQDTVYNATLAMATVLVAFLFFIIVIFAPGAIVATKRGWRSFVAILIGEFLWLVAFMVIYSVFFPFVAAFGQISPMI